MSACRVKVSPSTVWVLPIASCGAAAVGAAVVLPAGAVRGGVDQPEDGVRARPAGGGVRRWMQPGQHGHPDLHVAALQPAHLGGVGVGQRAEVAVLHGDQRRVVQCEVDLEGDQRPQLLYRQKKKRR